MRAGIVALVSLLWGCPSDVADTATFACEVHADCQSGYFCAPEGACRAGPIPADMAVVDRGPMDAAPVDAAPVDAAPVDAAPVDAAPVDAAPVDAAPVDAAPVDAAPVDATPDAAPPPDDRDGDGVSDDDDSCPDVPNADQADRNNNYEGDACEVRCAIDDDCRLPLVICVNMGCGGGYQESYLPGRCANGLCADFEDTPIDVSGTSCAPDSVCSVVLNAGQCDPDLDRCPPGDLDNDGVPDGADNCLEVPNFDQADLDGDGFGDLCDLDRDGDTVLDGVDNCPDVANPDQADFNNDARGDACQDLDNDGVLDADDNCIVYVNPLQRDRNSNGIGDACEVPCLNQGEACALRQPYCEPDRDCGAGFALIEFAGVCNGFVCANFAAQPNVTNQGPCADDEVCQLDAQTPCAPSDRCMPLDGPCNAGTIGRPCQYERDFCEDPDDAACGGAFATHTYEGTCEADLTCSAGALISVGMQQRCAADAICIPAPDETAFCQPVEECDPPGVGCEPDAEGAICRLPDEPLRNARCVDSVCRAWDCVAPQCNELGPRRFSTDKALRAEGERFAEIGTDRVWSMTGIQSMTLGEAHAVCRDLAVGDGVAWRLPTMFELLSVAARDVDRRRALLPLRVDGGFYVSRTVRGDGSVYGVSLLDGVAQPRPIADAEPHRVACVFERNAMGQDTWNLSARRLDFTDWRGAAYDTLTDLEWSVPPEGPGGPVAGTQVEAQVQCETLGAALPTVEQIGTLLTFNSGPRLPSPGYWLVYGGEVFRQADYSIWAIEQSMTVGEAWTINLLTGAAEAVSDRETLKVVCVRGPDGSEPGPEPEPDVPPEPEASPVEPDAPPMDAGVVDVLDEGVVDVLDEGVVDVPDAAPLNVADEGVILLLDGGAR